MSMFQSFLRVAPTDPRTALRGYEDAVVDTMIRAWVAHMPYTWLLQNKVLHKKRRKKCIA
jgi:hypothetical protein